MKLAEALLARADLQKRIHSLQARIAANASYQEGEEPAEDAPALLAECSSALRELEQLITAINLTNTHATVADGRSLTAALATREILRAEHSMLVKAADAVGGYADFRQLRSELKQISALPVPDIRARADAVAKQLRETDVLIQRANWEVDVLDP
ncbi:MAG: DIP1984 family protein [Propioniciclava sp.]